MARSVSVVVPVKDGERYLKELLDAVRAQSADAGGLELLVIDSGSTDGSVAIARAAGADVLEIDPATFSHGRTRNLGAERTTGEIVCFLTQDATPAPGWLRAVQDGFDLDDRVGAVYGPHLARPGTSPMIARELAEFFGGHTPDGGPAVQWAGGEPYLSNVNAAYRRACWEGIRFDDVPYAEDQSFARAMLAAGWAKVYHPDAAVLHAHDYPPVDFMRRYFDEYRGLRNTIGHVEAFGLGSSIRDVRGLVAADRRWMADAGFPAPNRRRWTGRAVVHHGGRKAFSALGSRAHALPAGIQRRISLEGTVVDRAAAVAAGARPVWPVPTVAIPETGRHLWDIVLQYSRQGPAPLLEALDGQDADTPLHVACVIPPFRRGSGGHSSIFQLLSRLEKKGHTVSVWLDDPHESMRDEWPGYVRQMIRDWFAPVQGPVFKGFADWHGADVVVATGWQTAHRTMLLDNCRARVYLVHDHENEFYPTSAESLWAQQTYGLGMHAVCSSPWLEQIVRAEYGGTTSTFDFGVDHDTYTPRPVPRQRNTVLVYGRDVTPRRAVPLALLALEELRARRPDVRIVAFGNGVPIEAPFDHEFLPVLSPEELSWAYSEATVGLVLSLTNYSLIPQEMLACGLPCVDLAGISAEGVFGAHGPVKLAQPDPLAVCAAIEGLLDDETEWDRRSAAGKAFIANRTWDVAADQVEAGLREAMRHRLEPDPS